MSRPAPNILLEFTNIKTQRIEKVLESHGIWAVYYQNKPVNLKSESVIAFVMPQYKKTSFSNKGHAINLAKKLNKQFNTNDFTVVLLTHGETVYAK